MNTYKTTMKPRNLFLSALMAAGMLSTTCPAEEVAGIHIKGDVVYGHKLGLAMTYDVLTPKESNGAAAVFMMSGGWVSKWADPEGLVKSAMNDKDLFSWGALLEKGYTVFVVRHGSSPKFKVPDAVKDVRRAIRHIRLRAADFGIDPDRIGVFGGSAGGHLSLMLGTASDDGDPDAKNKIDQTSNRVAAVAAYFPPTELKGYVGDKRFPALHFDKSKSRSVSPIHHVTSDDAPTLLLHGGKDTLVTPDHSEKILKAFQEQNVPARLITFPDAGHGFSGDDATTATRELVAWFETHLSGKAAPKKTAPKESTDQRLVGTWDAEGESPDGDTRPSTLVIELQDGKLVATADSDQGEFVLDDVKVDGKNVVFSKDFDYQGNTGVIKVEAEEKEPGKLVGTWSITPDGGDGMSGKWEAKKRYVLNLDGEWEVVAESNDGEIHDVEFVFKKGDNGHTGHMITEEGETLSFKNIKTDGKNVSFETTMDVQGTSVTIRSKGTEVDPGKIKGTWEAVTGDNVVAAGGEWKAKRKESKTASVVGEWDLEFKVNDQSREYGMKIKESDDGLEGVVISPRSGEYPCKNIEFKDGKLYVTVIREFNENKVELKYEAALSKDGKSLDGEFEAVGFGDQYSGTWTGVKK